jgi:hypothetical protein
VAEIGAWQAQGAEQRSMMTGGGMRGISKISVEEQDSSNPLREDVSPGEMQ